MNCGRAPPGGYLLWYPHADPQIDGGVGDLSYIAGFGVVGIYFAARGCDPVYAKRFRVTHDPPARFALWGSDTFRYDHSGLVVSVITGAIYADSKVVGATA